jgi:anion transporter
MADLADTIRNIPLFSGLSREDVAKIMGYLVEVECAAGHKIFSQGDQGDALYLIQSGAVDVQVDSGGGRSETIAVLGPQEYFGEMALLSSAPRSATMIAVKDCLLWKLSRESWDDLIAKHATWLLHFCAVLSQRLSEMDRQYSQGRHAFDSLADEFYRKQPPAVQQFYRHAALLTTLDQRAVGALLQTDAAGSYLTALESSQLPLIRRVNNDDYELHGFFREFLSERLLETEGAESKVGLHVAFAARYEALGDWSSAVEQSLAAKDWTNAGRTLIAHKDELSESRLRFVKDCLGRLPADAFYSDVGLVHLQVDTLCRLGDSAGGLRCLKEALARREAVLGAATVARYHHAADRMFASTDHAQALTYLRNALNLAAQQESVRSGHSESEVERAHGLITVAARDQSSLPGQSWFARFAGAREKFAIGSWLGGVLGVGVWGYLWFFTPDIGLSPSATKQLAILLFTLVFWVFRILPDYGVALIFALGFILTGLAKPEVVLGGFASTTWFMTLGVLGLGAAITSTGLFYRFSLQLVRYFPLKYNWQIFALGIMGIVVMALIPQQSARTAIISQMLLNLSESLGYKNPSRASTGLFVASFLGLGQLGFLFLTGSTTSLIAWGLLAPEVRGQFTWGYWFLAALPPTLIVTAIIVGATMLLYQPESQSQVSYKMVQTQLEILGPLSKYEWITLAVLCATVTGWLTGSTHKIDGAWVALLALCLLINTGVLGWGMLKKSIDWEMLIYMGATLSIPTLLTEAKIDQWLVGLLAPLVVPFSETPALAMIVIALITYAVKLVFTSFLTVVTLVIALLPLAGDLHINPWIMIMIVLVASEVWFFPFQVDWHTLAYATTDGKGFSYHDMKRIRLFYAAAYLIALVAAIPYWRYLGLMR